MNKKIIVVRDEKGKYKDQNAIHIKEKYIAWFDYTEPFDKKPRIIYIRFEELQKVFDELKIRGLIK